MVENIGDCKCIYKYDKNYILDALKESIDSTSDKIKELRDVKHEDASERIVNTCKNTADMLETTYLRNMKTVFDRVNAMNECD